MTPLRVPFDLYTATLPWAEPASELRRQDLIARQHKCFVSTAMDGHTMAHFWCSNLLLLLAHPLPA